jgi:hypothetical protein
MAAQPQPAATTETRSSFEIKMIQAGQAGADRRVVYECNFSVDTAVSREFMQYLRGHMREVRRGRGGARGRSSSGSSMRALAHAGRPPAAVAAPRSRP